MLEYKPALLEPSFSRVKGHILWDYSKKLSEEVGVRAPKMQACGPDFCPASSSLDILPPVSFWILLSHWSYGHCSQGCSNFHIPDQLFLVCSYQVQESTPLIVGSLRRSWAWRREAEGNPIHVYKYLQGGNEEKAATHFSVVPSEKITSMYLRMRWIASWKCLFSALTIKNTQISGSNEDICNRNI